MPPSQIAAYPRFYQPGVTLFYVVTTMVNYLAPTRGELDAGVNVTRQLDPESIEGFTLTAEQILTKDMANRLGSKIPGGLEVDDCSLRFYGTKSGADIRTIQPMDWIGYVVILPGGDVAGYKMDVWPAQVSSVSPVHGGENAFQVQVQYSITGLPALGVTIP